MWGEERLFMHCKTLIHILFYVIFLLDTLWLVHYYETCHTLTSSNFFAFPVTNTTALPLGTAMLQPVSAPQQHTVGMVKTFGLCHAINQSYSSNYNFHQSVSDRIYHTLDTPPSHTDQSLLVLYRPSVKSLRVETSAKHVGSHVNDCSIEIIMFSSIYLLNILVKFYLPAKSLNSSVKSK